VTWTPSTPGQTGKTDGTPGSFLGLIEQGD
jgi:hypothetical protein